MSTMVDDVTQRENTTYSRCSRLVLISVRHSPPEENSAHVIPY